jgi:phosphatidate cytidylyltransferase
VIVSDDGAAHNPPAAMRAQAPTNSLPLRVASALVLAPLAIGVTYIGGPLFIAFWTLAAIAIQWEWRSMVGDTAHGTLVLEFAGIAAAAVLTLADQVGWAVLAVLVSAALSAALARERQAWVAGGVVYAASVIIAPSVLRADAALGFAAMIFIYAVVWFTDILGYFVGRLIGGVRLWPRVSPKKTWSGAIGGALGAVLAALVVAHYARLPNLVATGALAILLSIASQAGDLLESSVKRRFGVKDASHIIPGHGGVMDRLDGFLAAALVAAALGAGRGGLDAAARGLLLW